MCGLAVSLFSNIRKVKIPGLYKHTLIFIYMILIGRLIERASIVSLVFKKCSYFRQKISKPAWAVVSGSPQCSK